ncbi:hypothetical protein OHA40_28790 [Nocardia sp. NBC_00508]|uniref:hypothetical protein n=1 Tax=Nocardia sp. NBC_00508 TaxID=2975992 RepID=UPI002E811001|nr:hypothetical protein [Nocardia sp. NBC_00508]WUD65575.1 hypothetical protein OHA40_28790 [Nocardia sp. NBC_00508]
MTLVAVSLVFRYQAFGLYPAKDVPFSPLAAWLFALGWVAAKEFRVAAGNSRCRRTDHGARIFRRSRSGKAGHGGLARIGMVGRDPGSRRRRGLRRCAG